MNNILFAIALIGMIGIACQWLGWWVKLAPKKGWRAYALRPINGGEEKPA